LKNRTAVVIAHRLSTIKNCDEILVLDQGNIKERGNHEALMALNGVYADLYNTQFQQN
jgi:ATP-binding cassette subfamily B protein